MTYIDFAIEGIEAGVWPDRETFPLPVLTPCQTHTCNVEEAFSDSVSKDFPETDALFTFEPGLRIGVRTADCVPVLLYAPDVRGVAAVHAGWKGSLGGIVSNAVNALVGRGADPERMLASFGPSICGRCYEVSAELVLLFSEAGFSDSIPLERHVDLESVNRRRMLDAGLLPEHIFGSGVCTKTTPGLPSWRRTNGTDKRLLTYISLKP